MKRKTLARRAVVTPLTILLPARCVRLCAAFVCCRVYFPCLSRLSLCALCAVRPAFPASLPHTQSPFLPPSISPGISPAPPPSSLPLPISHPLAATARQRDPRLLSPLLFLRDLPFLREAAKWRLLLISPFCCFSPRARVRTTCFRRPSSAPTASPSQQKVTFMVLSLFSALSRVCRDAFRTTLLWSLRVPQ